MQLARVVLAAGLLLAACLVYLELLGPAAQPDKEIRLSRLGFGERTSDGDSKSVARLPGKPRPGSKAERPAPHTGASLAEEAAALDTALAQLEGPANDTILATVVDASAAEELLPVFLASLRRLTPPATHRLLVFAVDAAALAACRRQHPQCLARSGRAMRAATAVDGNATDAAAAAQHSRKLLAEAAADSTAGNPDRTSGRRSREGRRAQAGGGVRGGAGGRVAGDLRGAGATRRGRDPRLGFGVGAGARREARSRQRAAEQPLEERRAQQLAWENVAVAADIVARNRSVLVAAVSTVWLQDPASAVASAAVAAAGGGPVDVLVAASDAPTARVQRLDASLVFARPSLAALGFLEEWLRRRRTGARDGAELGAARAATQRRHGALQVAELPAARFASGCCCGAAAAIEAGGWDAQSVPGERRAAWVAWQAKCVRTRALQRNAMQSVLDAAAT